MKPAPTSLAVMATALALAGCGGGGEGTTATSTSKPAATAALGQKPSQESAGAKGSSAAAKATPKQRTSTAPLPPPRPGSTAPAPGVPTSKHGDNSIQTYGLEASSAERARASAAVRAYLNARAAGDWAKACFYLAAKPRAEQRQLAQGAGCAKTMEAFTAQAPSAVLAEEAQIEVLSLRVGPKYAFLIYKRPDHVVYAMPLTPERGGWRLGLVTPTTLE